MNMFKKTGGFTLVELIVVIAILAILAGVAVPAYSGYIEQANKAGDITELDAVKTACQAALATKGEVTKIVVTEGSSGSIVVTYGANDATTTITTEDAVGNADFVTYYGSSAPDLATGSKATWEDGSWTIE